MARTDVEDAFEGLAKVLRAASDEVAAKAIAAAAEVYRRAAGAAAPRGATGNLAGSVAVQLARDGRVLAGPDKGRGYYGYFVEAGHRTAGNRRVKRTKSGRAHSQRGVAPQGTVAPHPWFEPAVKAAEGEARKAASAAFDAELRKKDR